MLNAAASMEILEDNLDRISIHSTRAPHSNSRESLHSSSKYDSAFDSHYSEDTASLNSQILLQTPCTVETSFLPSRILTPPLPYRVPSEEQDEDRNEATTPVVRSRSKKRHSAHRLSRNRERGSCSPSPLPGAVGISKSSRSSKHSKERFTHSSSVANPHQPEILDVQITPPARFVPDSTPQTKIPSPATSANENEQLIISTAQVESVQISANPGYSALQSTLHRRLSESSSTDDLISNDSTPTLNRRPPKASPPDAQESNPMPLTPQVTIIYPSDSKLGRAGESPGPLPRPSPYPKRGTLFYQESLKPPTHSSPLHTTTHRHTSPSHLLPTRYTDSSNQSPRVSRRQTPKRSESILKRLIIRKRGSFKEEGTIKRRLPVKRSFSERIAYNIRKGWIDYEEDLEFISQPSHPRAVGRMIDKKAGKFHVIQIYKPPSGKYGIFISQSTDRKGVFISRFSDSTSAKFYAGLINPGDEIIRVDGKNLGPNASVDYVYDLMTKSDSVIFTVIPVCSRPDW